MDNEKALNNVKAAIGLLEQIRKEMEKPPTPAFKRGDISRCDSGSLWIHDGKGNGRWVEFCTNTWTVDWREPKTRVRFATRAEWALHFPVDPYPLAPKAWRAQWNCDDVRIRKCDKAQDGWILTHKGFDHWRSSLHVLKGLGAVLLRVPDDVELKWEIVE